MILIKQGGKEMFKKKDKEVKDKRGSRIVLLIGTIIVGIAVFIGLVSLQNSLVEHPETEDAVVAKSTIAENAFIDKGKAADYFEVIQINKEAKVEGSYASIDDIEKELPAYIAGDIMKNSIITSSDFSRGDSEKRYSERAEAGFCVDSIDKAVSGTIRTGDHITIKMIDKITGEEQGTFKHMYVSGAYGSDGVPVEGDAAASVFNIWIESSELDEFNRLIETSTVRVSLDDN